MPLPTDLSLSLLGFSRPGDAVLSKPKTAMLVRMSAETLDALEAQQEQSLQFEFGDNPGIYVGDTYFPMKSLPEAAAAHEVYVHTYKDNDAKRTTPLKLCANVVGKFTVERELTQGVREKISESTQDAAKQRNSRTTVFMETPPDIPMNSKKRKDPAGATSTMFRKPLRPVDKGPITTTPISVNKVPAPSAASSSSKEPGVLLRNRVLRCLAAGSKPEEELMRLVCGSGASQANRREVQDLLEEIAERESRPPSDKGPPKYRLKPQSWTEVRPYEWNLSSTESLTMARNARLTLTKLGYKEGDPVWEHITYRKSDSMPNSTSNSSSDQSRPSASGSASKMPEPQAKRGVSSREVKEKAKKSKPNPKAEITAKNESIRPNRPILPPPESISRSESARSNAASTSRMNPPDGRRVDPLPQTRRPNESPRPIDASATRRLPVPDAKPSAAKVNGRPAPPEATTSTLKRRMLDRDRDDDRETGGSPSMSRVSSSTGYNDEKALGSQRIKKIKLDSGIYSDDEKDRERDRDRDRSREKERERERDRVASPAERAKLKVKREESPRDERLERAKLKRDETPRDERVERARAQERPLKREESPREERSERVKVKERVVKRDESPRDDRLERLKAKERINKREESPRVEKVERAKAKERVVKREESPRDERLERAKLKEKASKKDESPRLDMRAAGSTKRKVAVQDDEDDYLDSKTISAQAKRRKTEESSPPAASLAKAKERAREREREQERDDRERERERERDRDRKERERERDRKEREREREREREKDRERELRIKERDREERRKEGSPLKKSHVEQRSSKAAPVASSSRQKFTKREESPPLPPAKKKIPAAASPDSPSTHSLQSNDQHRSKSSSVKPRRRSPIYTSSEEEEEEEEEEEVPLKRRGAKNGTSAPSTTARKLPTDHASLRARYNTLYLEYLTLFQKVVHQRSKLLEMKAKSDALGGGSVTEDSDDDIEVMDEDDLEAITVKYRKLRSELASIQKMFGRTLVAGEEPPEKLK